MAASELATGSARTEQGALLLPPQPLDSTGVGRLLAFVNAN